MEARTDHEGFHYPVRAGRPKATSMPSIGDFVVLTLNPTLSVAHLDAQARSEAAELVTTGRQYVALVTDTGSGLPLKSKPTNEFHVKLVRDPWQPLSRAKDDELFRLPPHLAAQFAAPIHPHDPRAPADSQHQPIKAMADFPYAECVLDLAPGNICVRVTTSRRDCTQVLSVPVDEIVRLGHLQHEVSEVREMLRGMGEVSSQFNPQPDPEVVLQRFPLHGARDSAEDVSSTASAILEDGRSVVSDKSDETSPDEDDMLHLISALLKHSGHKNIPVVDVHYDLSEVHDIPDPSLFLRERWKLYQIIERATRRMLQAPVATVTTAQSPNSPPRLNHCSSYINDETHSLPAQTDGQETYAEKLRPPTVKRKYHSTSSLSKEDDYSIPSPKQPNTKKPRRRRAARSTPTQPQAILT